jgi:hypothetical protein
VSEEALPKGTISIFYDLRYLEMVGLPSGVDWCEGDAGDVDQSQSMLKARRQLVV